MEIRLEGPRRLIVCLSCQELSRMGFTYRTLSYKSERSRSMIQSLLKRAAAQTGFDYAGGGLMIEAFPTPGMGCTLLFTSLREEPQKARRFRQRQTPPQIFEFPSSEAMLSALKAAFAARLPEGTLYRLGQRYRLLLPDGGNRAQLLFSEYGRPLGRSAVLSAYTAEHGDLLSRSPVQRIGGLLSGQER